MSPAWAKTLAWQAKTSLELIGFSAPQEPLSFFGPLVGVVDLWKLFLDDLKLVAVICAKRGFDFLGGIGMRHRFEQCPVEDGPTVPHAALILPPTRHQTTAFDLFLNVARL